MLFRSSLEGVSVLVVDDNLTNRRILEQLLRSWGMRTEAATGAHQALALIRSRTERGEPFQLVLTDLHMPEMDGFGLVERLRSTRAGVHQAVVMMLTSGEHQGDLARSRQLGIAACLTKPVRRAELRTAVSAAMSNGKNIAGFAKPDALDGVPRTPRPEIPARGRSLHILLAEDNAVNERVACGLLKKAGHTVAVARNGLQLAPMLAAESFDVVLMDVQMPGIDGFEATAAIREMEKHTGAHMPVIAMTAHAMSGYKERCLAAGMDGYISKPIRNQLLLEALEKIQGAPETNVFLANLPA